MKPIKPTESELEILQVLWEKGPSTVRAVHEVITASKEAGYTTTLKLMQIMFEKGLLTRDDSARTHIYEALVSQNDTQTSMMNKMIDTLFNGSASQLIMQALGNHETSNEELSAIRKYLDQLKKK
jgi:predicted transcriptional regulator